MEQQIKRKRRSDRTHLIYKVTCVPTGELYVGMTVCSGMTPKKALEARWCRHVGRAINQAKEWNLCRAIRQYGADAFKLEVLHKVRGKAMAHSLERAVTKELGATLNTA